jgi:hypothetical protein
MKNPNRFLSACAVAVAVFLPSSAVFADYPPNGDDASECSDLSDDNDSSSVKVEYRVINGVRTKIYRDVRSDDSSSSCPDVSYDSTPKTEVVEARKIETRVAAGKETLQIIPVIASERIAPVIPKVLPNQSFSVKVVTPEGKTLTLPKVQSASNGTLKLPALSLVKPGFHKVVVRSSNGVTRTIRIKVSK